MKEYCKEKYKWTDEVFDSIHWKSIKSVRARVGQTRFMQTAKIMHGWLPVGHMRCHVTKNATCPACGCRDETIQHMFQCPSSKMRKTRERVIQEAMTRGKNKKIPQHIMEAFCRTIKYEMGEEKRLISMMADTGVREAVKKQQEIGLKYMCRGFLATAWMEAMVEGGVKRAEQKMIALQDIVWFIVMEGIWNTRNEILHRQENYYEQQEDSRLNSTIRWYVEHRHEVLKHGDQFLARIDLTRLQYMRKTTKKRWIKHVEMARRIWEAERKQRTRNQTVLTSFFTVIRNRETEEELGRDPG